MTGISPINTSHVFEKQNYSFQKPTLPEQNSEVLPEYNKSYVDKSCLVTFYNSPLKLKKIQQEIEEKFIISKENENPKDLVAHKLHRENLNNFSCQLKDILSKNSVNTPNSIVEALKQTANTPDEKIDEIAKTYRLNCYQFNANKKMTIKREFLQTIIEDISAIKNPNGALSQDDINIIFSNALTKTNAKYDSNIQKERVKQIIKYESDSVINDDKIELNSEEIAVLKQAARIEPDEDISLEDLYKKTINLYVGGDYSLKYLPQKIQRAVLSSLPRYESNKYEYRDYDKYKDYKNLPVSRWLYVQNPDEFVKEFDVGAQYSYDKLQSCSKCNDYCENQFRDDNMDMAVKFIIHPKSDVSMAYDIGERKYGGKEVIYPPNQKFTILSKKLVEATSSNYDYKTKETYYSPFYRYEIHMQEV